MQADLKARAEHRLVEWVFDVSDKDDIHDFSETARVVMASIIAERRGEEIPKDYGKRMGYTGAVPWRGVADGIRRMEQFVDGVCRRVGGHESVGVCPLTGKIKPLLEVSPEDGDMIILSVRKVLMGRIISRRNIS